MAVWEFVLCEAGTPQTDITDLTAAKDRSLTVSLNEASQAGFSINGYHPEALDIKELSTDLVIYREGEKLFRGRIGPSSDDVSEDGHTVQFVAWDYREVLQKRIIFPGDTLSFSNSEQEAIAWSLINATQGRYDLGITRGPTQATGVTRVRTFDAGQKIGEELQKLSEVQDGYDWEIDADLVFRVYYPQRGKSEPEFTLDLGGSVKNVKRAVDPSDFANVFRMTGGEGTIPGAPTGLTATEVATGGVFPAYANLRYAVAAVMPEGETQVSAAADLTMSDTGDNKISRLTWNAVPGAISYNVYGRSQAAPSLGKIATGVTATTWDDLAQQEPAGGLPSGAPLTLSYVAESDDLGATEEGRWERQISDSDLIRQSSVEERAKWYLGRNGIIQPSYTLVLDPTMWKGPQSVWVGDKVVLDIQSGRISVSRDDLRVTEMKFSIGEDGSEQITATVGIRPRNIFEKVSSVRSATDALGRR